MRDRSITTMLWRSCSSKNRGAKIGSYYFNIHIKKETKLRTIC
ncbi:hypothetical protein LINPERPRIM_LOCUS23932 [Linum perenne]